MPLALAVALTLLAFPGHHADHRPAHRDTHGRAGAWSWRIRTDRFTGEISCRLTANDVSYDRRALTFRLGDGVDTNAAMIRIDGGPVRPAHAADMQLAALGVRLENDSLGNPSGGLVHIPEANLDVEAGRVDIRATAHSRIRRFRVDGFRAAFDAATAAGCQPDRFY